MINFYNQDNMAFMKDIPDAYYDLAILDPEYGIGASKPSNKSKFVKQTNGDKIFVKDGAYKQKDWDNQPAPPEYFQEAFRVSKHQIIFGVNYFKHTSFGDGRIVWDKLNGECDQFDGEIAYCSMNNRVDIVYYMWSGMMQGVYCGKNIHKALTQQGNKKLNEKRIHPTQKPVILYKYLLQEYAKKGFKIVDLNGGSFSLAIAADLEGFNLDIVEKDREIFKAGKERYERHTSQYRLF